MKRLLCALLGSVTLLYSSPVLADLPGDANCDGVVDLLDLDLMGTNFGLVVLPGGDKRDFNGDRVVNLLDLDILATNYGATLPATSVPEPTAALLLSLGLIGLGRRRE